MSEQMRVTGTPATHLARHRGVLALLVVLAAALAACAGPVGANRVDPTVVQADLARSATTTGDRSWSTRNVLFEYGLSDIFDEHPEDALARMHKTMVAAQGDPDILFALAELSYIYGRAAGRRDYTLAATVYAYAFLFPDGTGAAPGRFDPRLRIAADLYNWSLAAALVPPGGLEVVPRGGRFELPFGPIEVAWDPAALRAGNRELYGFVPIAELDVYGMAMRYRWSGIGAPLAASSRLIDSEKSPGDMVPRSLKVPLTALLRITQARRALVDGKLIESRLELHLAWDSETVSIDGEEVPLESEPTAALALTLTDMPVMEVELFGFLGRLSGVLKTRLPLVSTTPYKPGLIPVVFVHGTASSTVRWAEVFNRLLADPEIRSHYQFWFSQYDSGNPITFSALLLRDSLNAAVAKLDPEGKDPALRRMVLIGHSQGGLLVKMQAISSGDAFWKANTNVPFEDIQLSDSAREMIKRGLFVEPLPMVSRVVFVCTPHRGSYVAGRNFIANTVRRLLTLPLALTGAFSELAKNLDLVKSGVTPVLPSAVDNMSPRSKFIKTLQKIPVAPDITVNSIIAVEGDGPIETGNDGVVEYSSAHIEPVESELVVRWNHSLQGRPETIEEIRRILRLHIGLKN